MEPGKRTPAPWPRHGQNEGATCVLAVPCVCTYFLLRVRSLALVRGFYCYVSNAGTKQPPPKIGHDASDRKYHQDAGIHRSSAWLGWEYGGQRFALAIGPSLLCRG